MAYETIEIKQRWEAFYRRYYKNEIGKIAQGEKTSLNVDYSEVEKYDPDLAEDLVRHPDEALRAAEDALGDFDIASDASVESAPVRFSGFHPTMDITSIRSEDVNKLLAVEGIVRKSTDVEPRVIDAAFECKRCGTLTTVEQTEKELSEPHQCRGCERQGPFNFLEGQSDFIDTQKLRIQDTSSAGVIDINVERDLTGGFVPGDRVKATGILRAVPDNGEADFEVFLEGNNVEIIERENEEPDRELDEEHIQDFVEDASLAIAHLESRDTIHDKELVTREKLVTPFIEALGWDVMEENVILEYNEGTDGYVDYQLMQDGEPKICVEAKSLGKTIADDTNFDNSYDPNPAKQLRRYMRTTGSEYGVLTNGEKYVIYKDETDDRPEEEIILSANLGDLIEYTDRLARIAPGQVD